MVIAGIVIPVASIVFSVVGILFILFVLIEPRIASWVRTQLAKMKRKPLKREEIIYRVARLRPDLGTQEAQDLGEHIANVELGHFSARYLRLQHLLEQLPKLVSAAKGYAILCLGFGGVIPLLTLFFGNIS